LGYKDMHVQQLVFTIVWPKIRGFFMRTGFQ